MIPKYQDIRYNLTNIQIQILELLKRKSMYGYEIIQNFEERRIKLNTAVLYPALRNMEELKLVESFKSDQSRGAKRRKNYKLTEEGFSFLQSLFDVSNVPIYYLKIFKPIADRIKEYIQNKDVLVIDSTNFLEAKALFQTPYFFKRIPDNLNFIRYYNFIMKENIKSKDFILILFPFFIQHEINLSFKRHLTDFFNRVKKILKTGCEVWVIDLYWERHAIIDTLSFLLLGEVRKIGFEIEEMEKFIKDLPFKNFKIIKKEKGIIIFSIS